MSADRVYLVYDSRASYDINRASVLEALGSYRSVSAAMEVAQKLWSGQGAVLVSYQNDGANLTDEQIHGVVS